MIAVVRVLAGGDFRERVRRPAYLAVLLAAVALACLAVPRSQARWTVLDVGGHRGVYTSAYVGTAAALASALWLSLGGFYLVRTTVARDERTGVGQLLAAAPLRTPQYLVSKLSSNVLVLTSVTAVVAATALVLQLVRGESLTVDPVALVAPFVVLTLPVLVVTSALALLFETTPVLRGGVGNVTWFVLALVAAIAGQSPAAPLGGFGVGVVARSMATSLQAQGLSADRSGFSLGLTYQDVPLRTFSWDGTDFSPAFLFSRLLVCLLAVALGILPTLWFSRFDPARAPGRAGGAERAAATAATFLGGATAGFDVRLPPPTAPRPPTALAPVRPRRPGTFAHLLGGELRILVQGLSWWWWTVAAALSGAGLVLPVPSGALLGTWVWPVLVWSRLGTQAAEDDVEVLLRVLPRPRARLLAQWTSGVALTAVVGAGPSLAMVITGDGPGLAAWVAGALFIPSLALALGVVSRTHLAFQAVYPPLWYLLVNGVAAVDWMGAVRVGGLPAGPPAVGVAAVSVALLLLAGGVDLARSGGPHRGCLRTPRRARARAGPGHPGGEP